jgi:hypothetical protein
MQNSKQFDKAEGVFKRAGRRRTRRRDYKVVHTRPKTAPLWKRLTRCGMFVREGLIEKPIPRKVQVAIESSLQDRSEFLRFVPPRERRELAEFVGAVTAAARGLRLNASESAEAGLSADAAEAAFFKRDRPNVWAYIKRAKEQLKKSGK